jgi:hypothetical protein
VDAPLAVNTTEVPEQIVDTLALIFTVGATFTVMVFEMVDAQPAEFVPVTE